MNVLEAHRDQLVRESRVTQSAPELECDRISSKILFISRDCRRPNSADSCEFEIYLRVKLEAGANETRAEFLSSESMIA